jgi:hypothetical protein
MFIVASLHVVSPVPPEYGSDGAKNDGEHRWLLGSYEDIPSKERSEKSSDQSEQSRQKKSVRVVHVLPF